MWNFDQEKTKLRIKGNLRKPLGTRAARPHHLEKCGHDARAPSKKRGFRRLPKELNEYYKEHGLNAFGFKCEKKQNCVQSQKGKTVKQFHGSAASVTPLYDAVY